MKMLVSIDSIFMMGKSERLFIFDLLQSGTMQSNF